MKKILISALLLACFSGEVTASENSYKYETTPNQNIEFGLQNGMQVAKKDKKTVSEDLLQNEEPDTAILSQFVLTKELKKKYQDISKDEKIIEACEILQSGAGNFSYKSVHGKNKTTMPIEIVFENFSKNKEKQNADAYGEFNGKKYKIKINSQFQDAPAEALAPLIAREALVNREKDENDLEMAEQLQIAVWTQILKNKPYLEGSQNKLVKMQNKLKEDGNIDEYGAFLKEEKPSKSEKVKTKAPKGQATQEAFDVKKQEEAEKISNEIMSFDSKELEKKYKKVTKETRIIEALELLKDTVGKFSHDAILGKNITHKPISIKFKNLSDINPKYSTFDALGWKQAGKLNIFINSKHADAPAAAIAAILSHEALHQDEFDSLNEETYAWTMEASVWAQLCDKFPEVSDITHPLVTRENLLKKLLEKGNYSNKYIKKSVFSNPSYSNLPVRSPGFENEI